jgi:hypothetical protein
MANLLKRLYVHQKHCGFKDLDSLERLLFSHGFFYYLAIRFEGTLRATHGRVLPGKATTG